MNRQFVLIPAIVCLLSLSAKCFVSNAPPTLESELSAVRGMTPVPQPPGGPGGTKAVCREYAKDKDKKHTECISPYTDSGMTNDCDHMGCAARTDLFEEPSCGNGKIWANEAFDIWTELASESETAYIADPKDCWWTVACTTGSTNWLEVCDAGTTVEPSTENGGTTVTGLGAAGSCRERREGEVRTDFGCHTCSTLGLVVQLTTNYKRAITIYTTQPCNTAPPETVP